jgi:hypothetical protein
VFIAHIDKTYKNLCDDLNVKPELTKSSELLGTWFVKDTDLSKVKI